jgi:hypothetical protein
MDAKTLRPGSWPKTLNDEQIWGHSSLPAPILTQCAIHGVPCPAWDAADGCLASHCVMGDGEHGFTSRSKIC